MTKRPRTGAPWRQPGRINWADRQEQAREEAEHKAMLAAQEAEVERAAEECYWDRRYAEYAERLAMPTNQTRTVSHLWAAEALSAGREPSERAIPA